MKRVAHRILFCLLILMLPAIVSNIQAAELPNTSDEALSIVKRKIKNIKNKTNFDEALRLRILNAYYASEDNLDELQSLEQQIKDAQRQIKSLPIEINQFEKQIETIENRFKNEKVEDFSHTPVDILSQRLIFEKSKVNELMASISQLKLQMAEQFKRPQKIREQIAETKDEQIKTQQVQINLSTIIFNKQELDARQSELDSRLHKLNAMLTMLELENILFPLSDEAKKLELQFLNLKSESLITLVNEIDHFLITQRQQDLSKEQAELIEAQKKAAGKHLLIQEATKENIRYNQLLQETNKKLEIYLAKKTEIEVRHKQLEIDFQSAEKKISLAGLSPALGNLLREQRRNLPLLQDHQNLIKQIQKEIALASLELFQLDEIKKSLIDIEQVLLSRMAASAGNINDKTEKLKLKKELRVLIDNQKERVFELSSLYFEYSRTLADVDFSLHQLLTLGDKFSDYLDQRLLWVPSAPVIDQNYVQDFFDSVAWLIQVSLWQQTAEDIKNSLYRQPLIALSGLIMLSLLVWVRKKIRLNLQEVLTNSISFYSDRFNYTYYGFSYVFLLVLPIPLILFYLGWLLQINEMSTAFTHSIAQGLLAIVLPLLIIQFFYYLFKPKGVVQSLFGWQSYTTQLLYSQLQWIRFVMIPAFFLIAIFANDTYSVHSYSIGRLALIIAMLAMAYMLHRLTNPVNGLAKVFYQNNPSSWAFRLRYIWNGLFVLIPLVIFGFACAGYYQSALELQHKLIILLRLIFFTTLFHEVVIRWMVLTIRQLAIQNVKQKRKLQKQVDNKDKGDAIINHIEEDKLLDIPKINEQNKKLLNTMVSVILFVGVWLTLHDILPAFSIFDQVVFWQHIIIIEGKETLQPITLINVFLCLLYLLLMLIFVNNFPGLIDLLFARRYRMGAGSRYAIIQLTRYAVIAISFIAIANELGGSWSQVQWLVAALSVGLGFGLQEIFANMVSGIILLFERPIRVGDTVTVGDVSGKVCRIQMRATTITDWDQKELIVPNKTFITDKLVNWSLTDTVTRVVISVGVSYDSDDELALRILKQVVDEAPLALKDPEPSVYFLGFGDSSLDYNLRVFVEDLEDRLPVTDDIHRRIRRAFKEHNIEIPFPQRDLHIRSTIPSGNSY